MSDFETPVHGYRISHCESQYNQPYFFVSTFLWHFIVGCKFWRHIQQNQANVVIVLYYRKHEDSIQVYNCLLAILNRQDEFIQLYPSEPYVFFMSK